MSYNFRFVSRESRDFMYWHSKRVTQMDTLYSWRWVGVWGAFFKLITNVQSSKLHLTTYFTPKKNLGMRQCGNRDGDGYTQTCTHTHTHF